MEELKHAFGMGEGQERACARLRDAERAASLLPLLEADSEGVAMALVESLGTASAAVFDLATAQRTHVIFCQDVPAHFEAYTYVLCVRVRPLMQ